MASEEDRPQVPLEVNVRRHRPVDRSSSNEDEDEFKEARDDTDSLATQSPLLKPKAKLDPSTSSAIRSSLESHPEFRKFSPNGRRTRVVKGMPGSRQQQYSWTTDALQYSGSDIFVKPSQMNGVGHLSHSSHLRYVRRRHHGPVPPSLLDDDLLPPVDDDLEVDLEEDIQVCFPALDNARGAAGSMVKRFWAYSTRVTHFNELPDWLKDNDYLHEGHRLPTASFGGCMRSVFAVHTETGNIWSHLLGCVAFIGTALYFLTRPSHEVQLQEKVVFSPFFFGAIGCLAMSTAFHTMNCHSHQVGKLFSKLDYVGISLLIVGSFIPWLYYGFYCRRDAKVIYSVVIVVLGAGSITVSLWDKFGTPKYRSFRAGMFIGTGLSGVIPCIHYLVTDGVMSLIRDAGFHWMLLMASLYIGGAVLYAMRVPERFFPGKFDIWFQSHQIFHVCVIAAAFVHYHGIVEMATGRLEGGSCEEQYPGSTDMNYIPSWYWMQT